MARGRKGKRKQQPPGDIWQQPSTKVWVNQVLDDMVPKLEGSVMSCSLIPDDREGDVKFWVELGASIMFDKPIIAVAFNNQPIPERLRRVADEIVVLPEGVSPEASDQLAAALKRVVDRHGLDEGEV